MLREGDRRHSPLFFALWLFVILVSVIDGYLVLRNRHHLFEMNPVGRFLIQMNGGQVWYLLATKFAGTVLACALLLLVYWKKQALGIIIAASLAVLQMGLLLFLLLT
jgi:hypothetical protein